MAVSSVLNPEAIVGRQQGTSAGFQNFLTGGSPIGSSVVGSAANNIVGFQRASVKPQYPDINNVINSITNNVNNSINNLTSITNRTIDSKINNVKNELYSEIQNSKSSDVTQLQTVVQNIQNQVNQTLQQSLNNFSKDYQDRVKQVDDAKPIGILGKFLSVYRTAIDFINFFGNRKNINRLRDNLDALKNSFTESFEVAKLVRNVIIKIVKQLSSLPKASPSGGGGLNIDVDVPGGGLKRTAPRGLGNMFRGRGKMFALGAGALGLGAGGAAAVNALSDSDEIQPGFNALGLGGDPLSSFASIVERFSIAINELFGIGKNADKKGGSSGGRSSSGPGSSGSPAVPSSKETGPSEYSPGTIPKKVSKDIEFTKGVSELAKKYNVPEDYLYAVMGFETGGTFDPSITNKAGSGATGLIQFMPSTAKGLGTSTGELAKMTRSQQLKYVDKYFSGTLNKGASLSDVYMSVLMPAAVGKSDNTVLFGPGGIIPDGYSQNSGLDLNKDGKITKAEATKKVEAYLPKATASGQGGPDLPDFMLSPQKREELRLSATKVAQPPPSQQQGQVNFMPIDLSGGQQQQQSSGGNGAVSSPPAPQKVGPTVPMLPSNNPDNFLVLYSRMVYNVVDG